MSATRFAATVSYDGAAFAGSQRQAAGRTVQQELETAAMALFGEPVRVELAGRTDSGVHAIGQVAAFSAHTVLDAATVGRALNAHLPEDVAVRDVREVVPGFDPRRWARRRWYRYTTWNHEARAPLMRRTAWHVRGNLDPRAMQEAADALRGRQDFIACSGRLEEGRTSVRTIFTAGWRCENGALLFDIEADAFLPQMVRRLAGAMARVGRGTLTVEEFVRLLRQAEPGTLGPVAPAHGLCLQRVWYDEGYEV
ncbi:tRNA pseudouridine(38-40) synthase TruA [bacterium]|nr:MAG: tRNA pseudouridine(38-40) synthase TruA [bacterium]MCL4231628.1 tRNA pseudouridine(38-40) synthase TruA [Dehalococcoidia bacterium]